MTTNVLPPDNSSVYSLNGHWACIYVNDIEHSYELCNLTRPEFFDSSRFCAMKEEDVFCYGLLDSFELPSACDRFSTCTIDCRAALVAKYGCCLTFSSRAGVVTQKWGTCEFNVTNTCPSLLPQSADTVPIT